MSAADDFKKYNEARAAYQAAVAPPDGSVNTGEAIYVNSPDGFITWSPPAIAAPALPAQYKNIGMYEGIYGTPGADNLFFDTAANTVLGSSGNLINISLSDAQRGVKGTAYNANLWLQQNGAADDGFGGTLLILGIKAGLAALTGIALSGVPAAFATVATEAPAAIGFDSFASGLAEDAGVSQAVFESTNLSAGLSASGEAIVTATPYVPSPAAGFDSFNSGLAEDAGMTQSQFEASNLNAGLSASGLPIAPSITLPSLRDVASTAQSVAKIAQATGATAATLRSLSGGSPTPPAGTLLSTPAAGMTSFFFPRATMGAPAATDQAAVADSGALPYANYFAIAGVAVGVLYLLAHLKG